MSLRISTLLLPLLLLLTGAPASGAGDSASSAPVVQEDSEPRLERARRQWRNLPPARRAELRRRHEALRNLDPEKRAALVERLRDLGPERSRRLLRNWDRVHRSPEREEMRHRISSLHRLAGRLTPEERERFRDLPPGEPRRFLEERLARHIEAHRASLDEGERAKFDALDRRGQYGALRRSHTQRAIAEYRAGLSPAEQQRFDTLEEREQAREFHRDRQRSLGRPPRGEPGRRPRGGDWSGPGDGPPSRTPAPPEIRAELDALPRGSLRRFLRDGTLPDGVELSPAAREWLESAPEPGQPEGRRGRGGPRLQPPPNDRPPPPAAGGTDRPGPPRRRGGDGSGRS